MKIVTNYYDDLIKNNDMVIIFNQIIILTLWLCSGQIDPNFFFFFPNILVNVIALDSNLLTLFT